MRAHGRPPISFQGLVDDQLAQAVGRARGKPSTRRFLVAGWKLDGWRGLWKCLRFELGHWARMWRLRLAMLLLRLRSRV